MIRVYAVLCILYFLIYILFFFVLIHWYNTIEEYTCTSSIEDVVLIGFVVLLFVYNYLFSRTSSRSDIPPYL